MYKGIAGSEGIGIGNVVIIEEHEIVIENKKITDTDAEIARLQGAIEKFVNDTNAMADRMEKTVGAKDFCHLRSATQRQNFPHNSKTDKCCTPKPFFLTAALLQ